MSVLGLSVVAVESVPEVDVSSAKTKFELVSARPAVTSNARSKLLFIYSSGGTANAELERVWCSAGGTLS